MTRTPLNRARVKQRAVAQLDLFGQVQVTQEDVYRWLLAVVDMDPADLRAAGYVRSYGVINKIVAAKLDGTFDDLAMPAKHSSRFRALAERREVVPGATAEGVARWPDVSHSQVVQVPAPTRATRRPADVIARERDRQKVAKRQREKYRASMLLRLPATVPPLPKMLDDLGGPDAEALAEALHVHPSSARRWVREEQAPHAVMLALFWLTRWGVSLVDANAHNDAINSARIAVLKGAESDVLRQQLAHVEQLADFGSANDPLPLVAPAPGRTTYQVPSRLDKLVPAEPAAAQSELAMAAEPAADAVPMVFTSIRRAPCADSDRKKKSA